jgi:hypothetical protein
MGKSQEPIEARPETGPGLFPPFPSYQIDRGRLENDLREIVCNMGVELLDDTVVVDQGLPGEIKNWLRIIANLYDQKAGKVINNIVL